MTTLRVEVGRRSGTTVDEVVRGLLQSGCMKYVEIEEDCTAFVDIDELKSALEAQHFHVELTSLPPPLPATFWQRTRSLGWRVYWWARRVVLRETEEGQLMRVFMPDSDKIHDLSTRESPMMRLLRKNGSDEDDCL